MKALPPGAKVLELASGHGVMGLLAAETRPDIQVKGFDISPPAVAVANRLLGVSGHGQRVSFEVKNALKLNLTETGGTYQGIIAAMLAEHLEDPRPLFKVIAHHLADDGIVFFSTALESAQRDHTFEFHHESEPLEDGRRSRPPGYAAWSRMPAILLPVAVFSRVPWAWCCGGVEEVDETRNRLSAV